MDSEPALHEPPPTFDVLPLSPETRLAVDELGYVHPTPVQRAVFEPATRGKDLVVQARTGTGKTAAFGLPLIDSVIRRGAAAVQALVLCPTRELALQVTRELEALAKHRGVKIVPVYGGAPMPRQVELIQSGGQIVVGTPGRVLDHLRRGTFSAAAVRVLVLDESDEMLSMGFLPQINQILSFLPETRQTLLFSATLPPDIQRMAEERLKHPEFLTLSGDHIGALEIQHFVYLSFGDKVGELLKIVEVDNPESAIVFCNTRDETKRVAAALEQQGYAADWLNADLSQEEREKVMAATRRGELRFLVATDLAARGIDISHLTHVLNFDFPETAEGYVHRTGRTGRAGRTGTAISLVEPGDIGSLYLLRLTYKLRPVEKQLPSAREMKTRAETDLVALFVGLFGERRHHPDDIALARRLLSHESAEIVMAGLLRDHLGARPDAQDEATAARRSRIVPSEEPTPGATRVQGSPRSSRVASEAPTPQAEPAHEHGSDRPEPRRHRAETGPRAEDEQPRPHRRERRRGREHEPFLYTVEGEEQPSELAPASEETEQASQAAQASQASQPSPSQAQNDRAQPEGDLTPPDFAEVYVNVGRRDGAQPGDFHAALREHGLGPEATDYVHVRHRHSFIGTRKGFLERVLQSLDGATIAGKQAAAEIARSRT